MKAQELRIWNWVSITPFGKNNDIQINEKEFADLIIFKTFHRIEPIPLTEDWLFRFGFELINDLGDQKYYKHKKYRSFIVGFDHQDITFEFGYGLNIYTLIYDEKHFRSVHQLQNLYYALTGEELCTK